MAERHQIEYGFLYRKALLLPFFVWQIVFHFLLPLVKARHRNAGFCTPDFDWLTTLLYSGYGLNPLFFQDCLFCGVS